MKKEVSPAVLAVIVVVVLVVIGGVGFMMFGPKASAPKPVAGVSSTQNVDASKAAAGGHQNKKP